MANNCGLQIDDKLYSYASEVSLREGNVLRDLREITHTLEDREMQVSPEQGQLMNLLVKLTNTRKILEIGTFTGYSTLAMAMALPMDGRIITCDVSEEWTKIAQDHWKKAGVSNKIELRLAPATETLESLKNEGSSNSFDLIFIDADKQNYNIYYELALDLLRTKGLMLVDNTLWFGRVIDPQANDEKTTTIKALNQKLKNDNRIELSLLPMYDGLTLVYKK